MPIPLVLPTVPSLAAIHEHSCTLSEEDSHRTIAGYALGRKVGSGCSGDVFEARSSESAATRPVAFKLLAASDADKARLARFQREAEITCDLSPHPHLVSGIEWGESRHDRCHYLVAELVEGQCLQSVLLNEGTLNWARASKIVMHVASALSHLAAHGVVHRDVKPENIILNGDSSALDCRGTTRGAEPDPLSPTL